MLEYEKSGGDLNNSRDRIMKKIISKLICLSLCLLMTLALIGFIGCTSGAPDDDGDYLPKTPNDPKVLEQWDDTKALKGIPRYNGGGIFDVIADINENEANVYYNLTSSVDYLGYYELLTRSGFKMTSDSQIWTTEEALALPHFTKGDIELRIVWSKDGTLAICVKRA